MSTHAAKLESSDRLRRLLAFLESRGRAGATTWELQQELRTCAAHSDIFELRLNIRPRGLDIERRRERETDGGRVVNRYVLVPLEAQGRLF